MYFLKVLFKKIFKIQNIFKVPSIQFVAFGHMSTYILKLCVFDQTINPLCINPTKWLNTLKQFVGNLPTNCFSVFDHFVKLALKGLKSDIRNIINIRSFITLIFFFFFGGGGRLRCVKCVQIFQRNTYQLML